MALKDLSQLVPDLTLGLSLATEVAASELTRELKGRGPYWTSQFYENWVVEPGQRLIPSDKRDESTWEEVQKGPRQKPGNPEPAYVPPVDGSLRGYTIANRMEYADVAMDHEPGSDGEYRHQRARSTAEANWFDRYLMGGEADRTLQKATKQAMGIAGFNR